MTTTPPGPVTLPITRHEGDMALINQSLGRNCVIPQLKDVGCCRARKRSVVGVVEGHGSCGVEDGGPGTFLAVGDIYDFPVRFEQIERRPGLLRIGIER